MIQHQRMKLVVSREQYINDKRYKRAGGRGAAPKLLSRLEVAQDTY